MPRVVVSLMAGGDYCTAGTPCRSGATEGPALPVPEGEDQAVRGDLPHLSPAVDRQGHGVPRGELGGALLSEERRQRQELREHLRLFRRLGSGLDDRPRAVVAVAAVLPGELLA